MVDADHWMMALLRDTVRCSGRITELLLDCAQRLALEQIGSAREAMRQTFEKIDRCPDARASAHRLEDLLMSQHEESAPMFVVDRRPARGARALRAACSDESNSQLLGGVRVGTGFEILPGPYRGAPHS